MDFLHEYHSPFGYITIASDGQNLIGLWFKGQKHYAATLDTEWSYRDLKIFSQVKHWLDQYFAGKIPSSHPPLLLRTTDFQQEVAKILLQIPYGQTTTYKALAQSLAQKKHLKSMAAQAIGQAVGRNPISLIIPCHRVIGSTGNLTGYAGGMQRKAKLLELEKAARKM